MNPTRVTLNSATLILLFLMPACSGTIDVDEFISDHKATYISISINISTAYYREVLNYKNADTEKLNQSVRIFNYE